MRIWNTFISALSICLLYIIGAIGEGLTDVFRISFHDNLPGAALPPVTDFVMKSFPLHHGAFMHILTPFMLLFTGVAILQFCYRGDRYPFWQAFVTIWLAAGILLGIIGFTLVVPFHLLLTIIGQSSWVDSVAPWVNTAILVIIIFVGTRLRLNRRTSAEQ